MHKPDFDGRIHAKRSMLAMLLRFGALWFIGMAAVGIGVWIGW